MASQPQNVWQARSKQQSGSRTLQNRSGNSSPAQHTNPTQKPSQAPANFWAQRASQSREASNGRTESAGATTSIPSQTPPNTSFNAAEVKAFLARDAQKMPAAYKPQEDTKSGGGGAWGTSKR
ncbi:hypothetical protein WHR41_03774 [Cladosporium halotolerans]|uniref:Uncharacterized protein n=1 Tax=Cladosporium halotolerans TaxID=1052096 RepID=A0AB34KS40_9PEZI